MKSAQYWIDHLDLRKHPEGGFFKEVYRSDETLSGAHLPERYKGDRCFSTAIYFLITAGDYSRFHKIKSDEIWHFYEGNPLSLYVLHNEDHRLDHFSLGREVAYGQQLQLTIPKNHWFGAALAVDRGYALVGCTVAPGFDFTDFEMADRQELITTFPQHKTIINMLT